MNEEEPDLGDELESSNRERQRIAASKRNTSDEVATVPQIRQDTAL